MPKQSWKYNKIMSVYKRVEKTGVFIIGEYSTPEIEYLKDNEWEWTEKLDGTNIRIKYDGKNVIYAGRGDDAQLPVSLIYKLDEIFRTGEALERLAKIFEDADEENQIYLYGEGIGRGVQKGGGKYISDGVDFVLFDVIVGEWQLSKINVDSIAKNIGIKSAPIIGRGTLTQAIEKTKKGFNSKWGDFIAEGLVARPIVEFYTRKGDRVIAKVKYRDFKKDRLNKK